MMRSIAELLASPDGTAFLEERGVFVDQHAFLNPLVAPVEPGLAGLLGLEPETPLVYVGQQVAADYGPSVVAKLTAARDLSGNGAVAALLLHDMDRAGSERYGMRFVLPLERKRTGVWLAPRAFEDREPRFIPVKQEELAKSAQQIADWARGLPKRERDVALERIGRLRDVLLGAEPRTLAQAAGAITGWLLAEGLDFRPRSVFVSELAAGGLLTPTLEDLLAEVEAVVRVFNDAIEGLLAAEVDPQVRPLPADWLPLWYACDTDGLRLRLSHERRGEDHFARGECRACGTEYRLGLGAGVASLDELRVSDRWSPDISLPMLHNDLVSGYVAGRSTALYGVVLNEVLQRVLGRRPVPAFVPPGLAGAPDPDAVDSLLHRILTA